MSKVLNWEVDSEPGLLMGPVDNSEEYVGNRRLEITEWMTLGIIQKKLGHRFDWHASPQTGRSLLHTRPQLTRTLSDAAVQMSLLGDRRGLCGASWVGNIPVSESRSLGSAHGR